MKNNKKFSELIIRFFEGDLSEAEKENLFSEIKKNDELREEFESLKTVFELSKDIKSIKVNQNYLDSILPQFRTKQERKNRDKIYNPGFASALAIILIALTIIFLIPKGNKAPDNFADIPDEELLQLLPQDNLEVIQQDKIDSLFRAEIKSAPEKISYYVFNGDEITNLYQKNIITPEDEDEIYLSLIDKKF